MRAPRLPADGCTCTEVEQSSLCKAAVHHTDCHICTERGSAGVACLNSSLLSCSCTAAITSAAVEGCRLRSNCTDAVHRACGSMCQAACRRFRLRSMGMWRCDQLGSCSQPGIHTQCSCKRSQAHNQATDGQRLAADLKPFCFRSQHALLLKVTAAASRRRSANCGLPLSACHRD